VEVNGEGGETIFNGATVEAGEGEHGGWDCAYTTDGEEWGGGVKAAESKSRVIASTSHHVQHVKSGRPAPRVSGEKAAQQRRQ